MVYRQLDVNGDYTFGNNLNNFWQNVPDAVAQAVQTKISLWQGEWFLDITEGTPYFNGILGKYTTDTADQLIKSRILETEGVLSIDDYSGIYDGNERVYSIDVTITTIYGTTTIQGVF